MLLLWRVQQFIFLDIFEQNVSDIVTRQLSRLLEPMQTDIRRAKSSFPPPDTIGESTTSVLQSSDQMSKTISKFKSDFYSESSSKFCAEARYSVHPQIAT